MAMDSLDQGPLANQQAGHACGAGRAEKLARSALLTSAGLKPTRGCGSCCSAVALVGRGEYKRVRVPHHVGRQVIGEDSKTKAGKARPTPCVGLSSSEVQAPGDLGY
jgi:hypothetical protein